MYTKPSKSKHKARDRWGDWGEWIWNAEHNQYYRYRTDTDGNYDYEWNQPAAQADAEDATVPRRTGGDVDDITEGVQNLSTTDYPTTNPATEDADYYGYTSGASNTKQSKGKGKSKKGKAVAHGYNNEGGPPDDTADDEHHDMDPIYGAQRSETPRTNQPYTAPGYGTASTGYNFGGYGPEPYPGSDINSEPQFRTEELPSGDDTTYVPGSHSDDYGANESTYPSARSRRFDPDALDPEEEAEQEDEELARAEQESRDMYYDMPDGSSSSTGAYAPVSADDDDGRRTPRASSPALFDISGTGGQIEIIDPRYRVEGSVKFQPGEVFKVLWSEPSGQVGGTPTISDRKEIRNQFGSFYVGFRRFIVIANDEGHCTCVPILTYGGKGCKKRGVKAQKHGIIHEKGHKARPLENEPKLGFSPARMMIEAGGEKLSRESRVNYSKLVTIEHNVKVFFIGHVVPEDWDIVRDAVNKCWEEKIHQRRKRQFQK